MVVYFCRSLGEYLLASWPTHDTVLLWIYNHMGNLATENVSDISQAIEYHRNTLPFSSTSMTKLPFTCYKQAG